MLSTQFVEINHHEYTTTIRLTADYWLWIAPLSIWTTSNANITIVYTHSFTVYAVVYHRNSGRFACFHGFWFYRPLFGVCCEFCVLSVFLGWFWCFFMANFAVLTILHSFVVFELVFLWKEIQAISNVFQCVQFLCRRFSLWFLVIFRKKWTFSWISMFLSSFSLFIDFSILQFSFLQFFSLIFLKSFLLFILKSFLTRKCPFLFSESFLIHFRLF